MLYPVELQAQRRYLVSVVGLEPTIPKATRFKRVAYTNSATQTLLINRKT